MDLLHEGVHTDDPLKLQSYWTEVHQIYTQYSQIIADEILKSEWRYRNHFRNDSATNKGE